MWPAPHLDGVGDTLPDGDQSGFNPDSVCGLCRAPADQWFDGDEGKARGCLHCENVFGQRCSREDNAKINDGEIPEYRPENMPRRKIVDARLTKKNGEIQAWLFSSFIL